MESFVVCESVSPKLLQLKRSINTLIKRGDITLLEYTYILNFLENETITNLSWLIDIINRVGSEEVIASLTDQYDKIFARNDMVQKEEQIRFRKGLFRSQINKRVTFTDEQKKAIRKITRFIIDRHSYGFRLMGFPGSGKTFVISEIVGHLVRSGLIRSVVLTAPTNQAVNIIKGKFRSNLKSIYELKYGTSLPNNFDFETIQDRLFTDQIKIDFITIHKLLNFKTDYDIEGEMIFTRNSKKTSLIDEYELIVIDECSMIPLDMIDCLFGEIHKRCAQAGDNYRKIPKIIFTGDPAQLPPVSETRSAIFTKSESDLPFETYESCQDTTDSLVNRTRYDRLISSLESIRNITLRNIIRSRHQSVVLLCREMRKWVDGRVDMPDLEKFQDSEHINFFQYKGPVGTTRETKIQTEWFGRFIESVGKDPSIIITWTNKQADAYNMAIRQHLFGKSAAKFEKKDLLIMSDFYNIGEDENSVRYYTSEQLKIIDINSIEKTHEKFTFVLEKQLKRTKEGGQIEKKILSFIDQLNSLLIRKKIRCWQMAVQRISENDMTDSMKSNQSQILVLKDDILESFTADRMDVFKRIKIFSKSMTSAYRDKIKQIESMIIRQFWKQWHLIFVAPYANVSYGYSITCHKAQGSGFYNVWVDANDILQNPKEDEMKRCFYTAITRTSNDLFLLF